MSETSGSIGFREGLRSFGPLGLFAIAIVILGVMVSPPIAAVFILLWVLLSGTPWREIGYVRPNSWIASILIGIAFGIAFKLLMKSVVMPLLGAPETNQAFKELIDNPRATAEFAVYVIIGAGFGEETVFRGWLFERLGKVFGQNFGAKLLIILITTALFAVAHFKQGLPGIEQAAIVGFVFAVIFGITGRIWLLMVTHAAFDLTAAAIIYLNLEARVAHLFFP